MKDNDWIEAYNRNGVVTARAVVSVRTVRGVTCIYHAKITKFYEPLSTITGNRGDHIMHQHKSMLSQHIWLVDMDN